MAAPFSGCSTALELDIAGARLGGRPVLGPMAFALDHGETLALVGPSGIGKSTLLRVIAGLLAPTGGQVAVAGRVAMVFQEPTLLPWRSARDNLRLAAGLDGPAAEAALAEVGLGGLGARFPGALSLGQQRRLALARAFAARPALLLLDEPFVSLDPALVDEMMALLARLCAAHPVATILVTHVAAEAARLAGRQITLAGSPAQIVADGPLCPAPSQKSGAYFHESASGVTSSGS